MTKEEMPGQMQRKLANLRSAEAEAIKNAIAEDVRKEIKHWVWRPIGILLIIGGFFGVTSYTGIKALQDSILKRATSDFEKTVQRLYSEQSVSNLVDRLIRSDAEQTIKAQVISFTEPKLREHTERLEQEHIRPLEEKANGLDSQVASLSSNILSASSELGRLDVEFNDMSGNILALRQFFNARRGDREGYHGLIASAQNTNSTLALALLQDIQELYKDFKNETRGKPAGRWGREIVSTKTLSYFRSPAETIFVQFKHNDPYQRRADVNETARRGMKYFVEDLVSIVTNDPNIFVASRAVSSIESLSGKTFGDKPPFTDVVEWWQTDGHTNADFASPFKLLAEANGARIRGQLDEALLLYQRAVSNCPSLSHSYYYIGMIQKAKGDNESALLSFQKATENADGFIQAAFEYADILARSGKYTEAVEELRKIKPYYEGDFEADVKGRSALQILFGVPSFKTLFLSQINEAQQGVAPYSAQGALSGER